MTHCAAADRFDVMRGYFHTGSAIGQQTLSDQVVLCTMGLRDLASRCLERTPRRSRGWGVQGSPPPLVVS